jgi:hypothetical protein
MRHFGTNAKPKLIAEAQFMEGISDDSIRHPSFPGLREDKGPGDVVRELPKDQPAVKKKAEAW